MTRELHTELRDTIIKLATLKQHAKQAGEWQLFFKLETVTNELCWTITRAEEKERVAA